MGSARVALELIGNGDWLPGTESSPCRIHSCKEAREGDVFSICVPTATTYVGTSIFPWSLEVRGDIHSKLCGLGALHNVGTYSALAAADVGSQCILGSAEMIRLLAALPAYLVASYCMLISALDSSFCRRGTYYVSLSFFYFTRPAPIRRSF